MFEDIAQLEKEIDLFRKNILASSELVEGIKSLTETTNKQKEAFSSSTEDLLKSIETSVERITNDHKSTVKKLCKSNDEAIEDLQKNLTTDFQAKILELEKIKSSIEENESKSAERTEDQIQTYVKESERLIEEMKSVLNAQQTAYAEKLSKTEETIRGYQADTEKKYNDFVQRLESTNVDQIYKEVQSLKRSIQTKSAVLMGGVGVSIVLVILSFLLK